MRRGHTKEREKGESSAGAENLEPRGLGFFEGPYVRRSKLHG